MNQEQHRKDCLDRHRDRVEQLKKCSSRQQALDLFQKIKKDTDVYEARSCWVGAFGRKEMG